MQIIIPSDFPTPKFTFGQTVETIDKQGYGHLIGQIVGMEYTSRDAALAQGCRPGWRYTVETPAFEHNEPHHEFSEKRLQLAQNREEDSDNEQELRSIDV